MNFRLAQLNPTIGDIEGNSAKVIASIDEARQDGIDFIVFPELVTCGYPPLDLLERDDFLTLCYEKTEEIIAASMGIGVIFGSVTPNESGMGRRIYNSAMVARNGVLVDTIHKTLLPTYDVFDDLRYFEPNTVCKNIEIDGIAIGITVCEDIWFNDNERQYHYYDINPCQEQVNLGADLLINISASPYTKTKPVSRSGMLSKHAQNYGVPILYCNQAGANTEIIFDGDSLAINPDGHLVGRANQLEEDSFDIDFNELTKKLEPNTGTKSERAVGLEEGMFKALTFGLKDYMLKTGVADKVVLGLSGGIDSALVSVIAAEALGPKNVVAVTMPSEYSSEGSVSDSEKLAENLGIKLLEIPIQNIVDSYTSELNPFFEGKPENVAEENLQSRTRGNLLMALSNKHGYLLLNTGNKSEMAVGYCTLYGDMAGGLSVISDVYKTEVYDLCRWLNAEYYQKEVIPDAILTKEPSAELRPDQKDSDSLPDYETLDAILSNYIEGSESRQQIIDQGFEEVIVERIIKLVDYNEHKRYQAPPGLKISSKAFGIGRRWPIAQGWTRQNVKTLTTN